MRREGTDEESMPAEGRERVFQEEGRACAKAGRPNRTWSYWHTEQSPAWLLPENRARLHRANGLLFMLKAMGSRGKFLRHSSDVNLWDFKQFISTSLVIGLLTTDIK